MALLPFHSLEWVANVAKEYRWRHSSLPAGKCLGWQCLSCSHEHEHHLRNTYINDSEVGGSSSHFQQSMQRRGMLNYFLRRLFSDAVRPKGLVCVKRDELLIVWGNANGGKCPKGHSGFPHGRKNTAGTSVRSVSVVATFERGAGRLGVRCISVTGMVDRKLKKHQALVWKKYEYNLH